MALSQVLTSQIGLGRHEAKSSQVVPSAPSIPTPCAREACKGTLLRDSDGDMTCHQCVRPAVTISPADAYAMRIEVERGGKRMRQPIPGGVDPLAPPRWKRGPYKRKPRHGTRNEYDVHGCRCEPCCEANRLKNVRKWRESRPRSR